MSAPNRICLIGCLVAALVGMTPTGHAQTLYGVLRVIDGDTIELETVGKVRLIGVDTPETVHPSKPVEHFGKEASDFLRHLLEGGEVWLEYDWQRKDKYGRTLAYVYLPDSTFVNEAIIRFGYGHGYTNYPFKYLEEFRALEREAREAGRGLWAPQTGGTAVAPKAGATGAAEESEELTVYVTRTGSKYHREGCRYLARSMIPISLKEAVPKIRPVQRLRPADRRVHLQVLPVNLPTTHAKHIDSLSGDHEEGHSV